nr:MAG: ORF1 [Torque teno midi virus]
MPFWWNRRKRWWRGRRRPYYRKRYKTKRRRPRRFNRTKYRRTYRRHRRRRKKVRRKRQKIPLQQWQPQTIRKCKIKGIAVNVLGGEGRQFVCYTDSRFDWNLATTPGGGGFGVEKYTLGYLYLENKRGNNIWTTSNQTLDLVRYTGCQFKFFRHEHLDFVVVYDRNYPMTLEKYTYAYSHPYNLLQQKHKVIIPSLKTQPLNKKTYVKVKVKPPRQMSTKWFFQEYFSGQGLLTLYSSVIDLRYSHLSCCNSNQLVTFYSLNGQFYQNGNWGYVATATQPYMPYKGAASGEYSGTDYTGKKNISTTIDAKDYATSVSYKKGWFNPQLLQIAHPTKPSQVPPLIQSRYNPTIDTGVGNQIWVSSLLKNSLGPPETDTQLILEGLPLWQLCWGFLSYVTKKKGDKYFLKSYIAVFKCKYCEPQTGDHHYFIPIDPTFIQGQNPYGRFSIHNDNDKWFPNVSNQLETINNFVQTGPFVPNLDNQRQSTWELKSRYTFYFKWGGGQQPDQIAADPSKQVSYDVPDKIRQAVQICNPTTQDPTKILHAWDFRRGFVTGSALKRILKDSEDDSTVSILTDTSSPPKKRKKKGNSLPLQEEDQEEEETCLLSLFEENTCQDPSASQNLFQLIQQQQQQQQSIKLQLLQLIASLKKKQKMLQLQTGMLS